MKVTISHGLAQRHRQQAASMFWQAFRGKLNLLMRPDHKALDFLNTAIDPNHAISAIGRDGTLLGVAGFKTKDGAFIGGSLRDLAASYGWLSALWRGPLLGLLERDIKDGILLMDGIFVADAARGKGIGTMLLTAIKAETQTRNLTQIRLDVINTNPRAKALYERQGFRAGPTSNLGPLKYLFHFSSATTMICDLDRTPA